MKINKRLIIILSLLIISLTAYYFLIGSKQSEQTIEKKSNKEIVKIAEKENFALIDKKYSWDDLGIKPIKNLEGNHYVFTAFDFDEKNNELIIAGNYDKSKVLFVKNKIITEIEIEDIPIDILINKDYLYILCIKKFIIIKNKKVIKEFNHNITNVTSFDKLLFFDNNLNILMSDGSAYKYLDNNFVKSKSLLTEQNNEIWIQKTSSNSFAIKSEPTDDNLQKNAIYNNNIGSITFLGEHSTMYYVIVDVIKNTKPISVIRELKSSSDNFKETIIKLPSRKFSFIKNDIKIHKDKIYTVTSSKNYLTIKSTAL